MSNPIRLGFVRWLLSVNEWVFTGLRLKKYYRSLLRDIQKPVILDVGANRGQSIRFFLSLNKRSVIYAFEPNPVLFQQLSTTYNGSSNVHVFPFAVSDTNGEAVLQEPVLDETATLEPLNFSSAYLKKKAGILGVAPADLIRKRYKVQTIRLRDFLEERSIFAVDVLKIDTEGHEAACLRGLYNSEPALCTVSCVQLEQHYHDMYLNRGEKEEAGALLTSHGFCLDRRIRHGFGHFYELLYRPANRIRS